jgi:hypothetical protein
MQNTWNFNNTIGVVTLGDFVSDNKYDGLLILLEKWDYEYYDTYAIKDGHSSKVFAREGVICEYLCGGNFIISGRNYMGSKLKDLSTVLVEAGASITSSTEDNFKLSIGDFTIRIWVVDALVAWVNISLKHHPVITEAESIERSK